MIERNGKTIAISGDEFAQALEQLKITFQNKTILWNGQSKLVTTVLQEVFEMANGKVQLVIADTLPQTTVANTQYWVKTYEEQTLETGRFIIVTDSLNAPTYIGTTETDLSEYLKKTNNPNKLYGTDGDGEQQEYNIINSLATDYYYKWNKDSTNKFTKQITDGTNIDVYDIVFENGKVKTITKSATDGVISNGVLTLSEVEYSHDATGDGIYLVNSDIKIINASALNDLLNAAGKVKYLHTLVRYNSDTFEYTMGWAIIINDQSSMTVADFKQWLIDNGYTTITNTYWWCGGCPGTTNVRNSADTGTAYVGKVASGIYVDGTSLKFKADYNATVTINEARCKIHTIKI